MPAGWPAPCAEAWPSGGAIVVEFSRTGNAAWFYDPAQTSWDAAAFASAKDFRDYGHPDLNRMTHQPSDGWQDKFENELAAYGVSPY